jgi:hypothetical protein
MADMSVERSRIVLLAGVAALVVSGGVGSRAWPEPRPEVTVYKSPT